MATHRINGVDVYYQDDDFSDPWKPTETIFMLHGFSRNGNFWRSWVPTLARHYRVIRMDIRGCGQSRVLGNDFTFELDDVVSDCLGLLDALDIDKIHHVGEATGGIVGCLLGAHHAERLASLTLVSTPTSPGTGRPEAYSAGYATPQEAMSTLGMKEWWLRSRRPLDDPAQAEYFANEVARTPVRNAMAMWGFMHGPRVDTGALLAKIDVPTLLLTAKATFSGNVTLEQQTEMLNRLQNARQKIYDAHPNDMFYVHADELARDTLEFIDSVSNSAES
jgi:3-oxoadipate enol-lactonase